MSNQLATIRGRTSLARETEQVGREIQLGRLNTRLNVAAVQNTEDVYTEKVHAIGGVSAAAAHDVTRFAQLQTALEQLTPEVSGRLNVIGNAHLFACVDVIDDLRRDLRSIR